ncbi:MAG: LysR family transcriptional regulator, low CO2-responsive transcriptional regulator [Pseudomonadota bacterium]|nr:LysR family transcriptional regulator, low CO2-responsive transcriptional regulator [Pseudomonadota bacterium]MDQ5915005.1 LysR family transcriptional regulator, low CO2-responsive transcriptional regulator [Pseudomonadota bacterium]MDQ5946444.1 LysR family transcriptional regulator, low CO2-responsive transcriptional regulator [Pseudomonadota bacterium]
MPRRRITFRQLETFSAVARLGSFTKAAEALHLTQPAVSIQIRQVVDVVGMPLFEQNGREITLTAAGEELQSAVRNLDDVWNRLESALDALKGLKRGRLRVALVTTAKYFLPRMLGTFCRQYPDIDIELEIGNREKIIGRLRGNEDDLYVMSYPPTETDIVSYPFLENEYVVIAPATHWAAGKSVTLEKLATEPFLLREQGSGSRQIVDQYLGERGIELNVRLSLASNEAIRELVASGMGLSILSRHALGEQPERDGLTLLKVKNFSLSRPWCVVHLRTKVLSLPAQAFLHELLNTAARSGTPRGRSGQT